VDERAFDVVILGAGPAGCATALALRAQGIERVLIADRARPASFIPGESATPDIAAVLAALGLDPDLGRLGALPYFGNLSAWCGPPQLSLFGRRGQGWHLDRTQFEEWLRRETVLRGAPIACPARLQTIARRGDGWDLEIETIGTVRARVVVDAAGRRAPFATRLGAKRHKLDDLVALAVRIPSAERNGLTGFSFVESFADGWWYTAPVPSGECVVMLMTDRDIAQSYREPETFVSAWHSAPELSRRIPPPQHRVRPRIFAAHGGHLDHGAGERWIAVGDALLSLDPLTSSGLSGAFNDGIAAADAIVGMLNGGDPSAAYSQRADVTLKRYQVGRAAYYGLERRWTTNSFWARRIQPAPEQLSSRPLQTSSLTAARQVSS
jgi:flavin-dependent dehydrogenase